MSTTDLPGSSLLAGRYRLVERLGAGGMSVVWRGFDEVLGRQVAVKVLPPSTSADPSFRRRLRAEAQAAARLSHQHITNVYDYGEATTVDGEPVPYVVMELIDGESLAAVLARVRRLPWQHAVQITAEVAAALAAAHARGIVHRDVTPANVMLTSSGAKVVDFGISALIGENDIDPDGSLLGTPAYLAPERLEGGQVSPATDVYAVGLLIYRTLIGQLPWDVGTTTALLRAHQYVEPDPLPPVEGMPPAVDALVGRCLEKRPQDRPSSAELAHVLAGIAAGAPASGDGYIADWGENGEDTTILPAMHSYPDVRRPGPAFPPPAEPAAAGPSKAPVGYSPVIAQTPMAETPPPVRNSRFGALRSGPVSSAPVSPAVGPVPPVGPPPVGPPPGSSPPARHAAAASGVIPGGPAAAGDSAAGAGFAAAGGFAGAGSLPAGGSAPAGGFPSAGGSAAGGGFPSAGGSAAGGFPSAGGSVPGGGFPSAGGSVPGGGFPSAGGSVPGEGFPPAGGSGFAPAGGSGFAPAGGSAAIRPSFGNQPPPDDPPSRGDKAANARRPGAAHTRRVMVVAGAVVVLGLVTYGWSLAVGPARNQAGNGALSLPAVVPASGKCVVSYAVWSDAHGQFSARVTVANRNDTPIGAWKLWFIMPGDQVLSGKGKVRLTQQDNTVTVSSTSALASRKSVTLPISGRYKLSNATPLAFTLNDHTCETFVSRPGEAPRRVEHLSDGGVRLAPTTGTPASGVSVDPGGVVHITPTTTPPSIGRTTAPTPSPTETTTKADPPPPSLPPPPTTAATTPPTTPPTTAATTPPHTTPPASPPMDCDPVDPTCNGVG